MKRDLEIAAALVIATLVVYAQTLGFDFVDFDDNMYVTHNAWVKAGLGFEGVRAAFFERAAPINWSPLVVLSYMLDVTLFGITPAAFHATNVVLHAIDAVLVYVLLRSLTAAVWPSAIVAALFALHPLRVESVAWVASRKDVLSAAFGLLALIAYARFAQRGSRRAYAASLACTVAALLSKITWVSLPALFLLLDFWPLRRIGPSVPEATPFSAPGAARASVARLLAEKLPFFAVAIAMLLVATSYQSSNRVSLGDIPLGDRVVHGFVACAWYVAKTLWPVRLSVHYPHPYFATVGGVPWTHAQIALAALLLAALTALVVRFARRGYPLVGWLWFLGTLVPVLGFVQYGTQGMADRYTHLPQIGLFVAAVFSGWEMVVPRLRSAWDRRIAAAAIVALLFALGAVAFVQTRVWRDSESLFTHALAVMPRDAMIQEAAANFFLHEGRFDDALRHSKAALNIHPDYRKARKVLEQALARRAAATPPPPEPDFLFDGGAGDGLAHEAVAGVAYERGDHDAALDHVRRALALDPDSVNALWQLGVLLRERGDHAGARDAFRRVVALAPDSNDAREALTAEERTPEKPR
jgi:tetratricopeptide (TPR) repeat protein